ncbi:MAG: hypothetical protein WD648_14625 [Planctomycetaceae bacterium]
MSESTIIVFERRPRYTPELQRQFWGQQVSVRACRSIADIKQLRDSAPGAVLLLDLEAAPAEILQFLGGDVGRANAATVIVAASRHTAPLEWRVRELGAAEFLIEPVSGERLANLCRRQQTANRLAAS